MPVHRGWISAMVLSLLSSSGSRVFSSPLAFGNHTSDLFFNAGFLFKVPRVSEVIRYLSLCVWLISLSTMPSSSIHVLEMAEFPSFLWLNIPVCMCVCVCVCVCVDHSFFIHLFISDHFSCFHVLAVVKGLLWTWRRRYLFNVVFSFPSVIFPEVKLLDHMVVPF